MSGFFGGPPLLPDPFQPGGLRDLFGEDATGMHTRSNQFGGTHYSVYGDTFHFSWDTNQDGSFVDGSEHGTFHDPPPGFPRIWK
jgi:hypothetical protein